jgi:hypothetical protein
MWSSNIEQLKGLNTSDQEIAQVIKLKHAGISDDTCVELVSAAHVRKHLFISGDSASNLAGAGFAEPQILEIARADQLDTISIDAPSSGWPAGHGQRGNFATQKHRFDGTPNPRSYQSRNDRRTGRKRNSLSRECPQSQRHLFCACPRPEAALMPVVPRRL